MKKFCLALLALFILGTICHAEDLPFTIEKGYIIVPAKVMKDIPVEVAIATGLQSSVIESAPYGKFKLTVGYTSYRPIVGIIDRPYFFMFR